MIRVEKAVKRFENTTALNGLDLHVEQGSIYGLVGTNGAGKTTVIKALTGIQRLDGGKVLVSGRPVYENPEIKGKIGYVSDDTRFLPGFSLKDMAGIYRGLYPGWNGEEFAMMAEDFHLDLRTRLSSFSKGMQKQAALILALSTAPTALILDEPIDGLDPVVRRKAWKHIIRGVSDREMTVLVSSHNLREMEGYCDHIGIISRGKMVIERDLEDLKTDVHKVQIASRKGEEIDCGDLNILHREKRGSVELLIIRDKGERIEEIIGRSKPPVFDRLPLSLEEIFIFELGGESDEISGII